MADYNPTSRKLTKQKAHRKSAIKRSSKSYWDLARAGSTSYAVADTANAIGAVTSSMLKIESAITPTKQAYEELNIGRKEVGLEEQEYSMWDMFGKGPDVTGKETAWKDMEIADADATAVQQTGHQYTVGELKNIGREVKAGTSGITLEGHTWQDVTGKDMGTRAKPRPEQFGEVKSTPQKSTVQDMTETSNAPTKSVWNTIGEKLNTWMGGDKTDNAQADGGGYSETGSLGEDDLISPTENQTTESMDNAWKSQYKSMNLATIDRNKDSTKFSDIEQKGINEAYRMGDNDFDKASEMWGTPEWLENMQQYR